MLERFSVSGILVPIVCCWLSALPAESQPAGLPDSAQSPVDTAAPSFKPVSRPLPKPARGPYPGAPLLIGIPVVDMPYGFYGGFESPSMRQSVMWNAGYTQWADQSIGWLWEALPPGGWRSFGTYASLGLFNYFSVYFPLGQGWMHEEWHRAVFTRYRIPSYNGVYHWDIGSETIAVDHVSDGNLAEMKSEHPADFVRLMEAGLEGEVESVRMMQRNNFFLGRPSTYDLLAWWTSILNGSAYLYICSVDGFDDDLEDANRRETAESARDFTGFDFRAWVYDMRRPDEPYQDSPRGRTHPTGSGFDRYLLYSDLSRNERQYLRLQAALSLLNLVSPQMFGHDWLPGHNPWDGRGLLWNFSLVHHLTPFGYEAGGDILLRRGKFSWVLSARGMVNEDMVLPGLGGELFRLPVVTAGKEWFATLGASAWMQPEDQLYRTGSVMPGGAVLAGASLPVHSALEIFVEADAKTAGWVAGNVYLDASVQGRAGFQLKL